MKSLPGLFGPAMLYEQTPRFRRTAAFLFVLP